MVLWCSFRNLKEIENGEGRLSRVFLVELRKGFLHGSNLVRVYVQNLLQITQFCTLSRYYCVVILLELHAYFSLEVTNLKLVTLVRHFIMG